MVFKISKQAVGTIIGALALATVASGATEGLLNRQHEVRILLPRPQTRFEVNLPVPDPVLQIIDQIQGEASSLLCPAPARNEPVCTLDSIDVSLPNNNFDLMWRCDGALRPCALFVNDQPAGSVRGSGVAHLTLPSSIAIYQLKDRNDRSCGTAVIHGFKSSGAVPLNTPEPPAVATYTQSGYRFYDNANSTTPGSALAAINTAASASSPFRLRLLLHVGDATVAASEQNFKLQFAPKITTCVAGSYSDVETGSGNIRYNDNAAVADGATISAGGTDPTHGSDTVVVQTYEESNNFSNPSEIAAGRDGEWDFSLRGFLFSTFCFRAVKSDGTALDTYDQYPELSCTGEGGC